MAEVIAAVGVVASVAQLADFGFRLSVKLFTYSKAVASADTSIKDISNDVSLTSTVLKELCQILQSDESHVVSENAIEATSQTVKECLLVFEQLNDALDKSLANLGVGQSNGKAKRGMIALEKLKWPFKQNKMELLRSNLDRLKASLTLMLQVQSYARDLSNRKAADSSFAYQKHLIESLSLERSEKETKYRYLSLQKSIEGEETEPVLNAFMNTSVHITETRDMSIMSQSTKEAEAPTTPVVHHRTVIGELLLCFQLLNDVLGYHMAISNLSKLSSMGYNQLRDTLEKIHVEELNKLKEEFSDDPIHIKAEAAQNLEARLKELARAGYSKERKGMPIGYASNNRQLTASLERLKEEGDRAFGKFQDDLAESLNMPGGSDLNENLIEYRRKYQQIMGKFELEAQEMERQKHNLGQRRLQSAGPGMTLEEWMRSTKDARSRESDERPPAYDPYQPSSSHRSAALRAEIDSTTKAMRENINKVSQRGERLDSLQDETENLSVSSQGFRRGATRVRTLNQSLWAQAYRGVTQGVELVGGVGIEGYKAVKVATGSVYEVATGLLQATEDEPEIPESVGSTSPAGPTPQSSNPLSERFNNRRFSFDDDEDDLEAASGPEAMRIAEEQDTVAGKQAAMELGSNETLPQYSSVEGSDDEYTHTDMGPIGGGYEAHMSYGGEEAKEESENEDIVGGLLSQWTNLPSNVRTAAGI